MTTVIRVIRGDTGRLRLDLRAGELSPRVLDRGPDGVRVALVATVALLLAGDDVRIEVEVGAGLHLELVETAGTVAYAMRGGSARWSVSAVLGDDARLSWVGLPLVVSDGADVVRRTHLELASGARALLRESIVLGRHGETGGRLLTTTDVRTSTGHPVLRETLDLRGPDRHRAAVLGTARCVDQLLLLGARVEAAPGDPPDADVLQLAAPGTLVRSLAAELHHSRVPTHLQRFQMELRSRSDLETELKQPLATILPSGCIPVGKVAESARGPR